MTNLNIYIYIYIYRERETIHDTFPTHVFHMCSSLFHMAVSVLTSFKNDRKNSKCTAGGKIGVLIADTRLKNQECSFFEVSEASQARGKGHKLDTNPGMSFF